MNFITKVIDNMNLGGYFNANDFSPFTTKFSS
jgi:hypothetical protein